MFYFFAAPGKTACDELCNLYLESESFYKTPPSPLPLGGKFSQFSLIRFSSLTTKMCLSYARSRAEGRKRGVSYINMYFIWLKSEVRVKASQDKYESYTPHKTL